jgi:predicted unusual protein kinase regulating ubiquinone biosynthesis (AarF/ABC1/UbiB family)
MQQLFEHNFVHADPHPGNIFVEPLEEEPRESEQGRPFRLVFVDFGMVAEIPEPLRQALREYIVALGTRDARRMILAAKQAGVLLPEADLERLEQVHREVFDRFWGVRMGEMRELALNQAPELLRQYWDVLRDAPFQMPVELLFVGRAVALLSGMATSLDPEFDPWSEAVPWAERLGREQLWGGEGEGWLDWAVQQGQLILRLPAQAGRVLSAAERGELVVQASLAPDARRSMGRLERGVRRLAWTVFGGSALVAGTACLLFEARGPGWGLVALSLLALLLGLGRRG